MNYEVHLFVIDVQWDEEPGFCLNERGSDQNDGIKNLVNRNNKLECLQYCEEVMSTRVTGCEYHRDGHCSYHSKPVSGGNGNQDYTCWVLRNA